MLEVVRSLMYSTIQIFRDKVQGNVYTKQLNAYPYHIIVLCLHNTFTYWSNPGDWNVLSLEVRRRDLWYPAQVIVPPRLDIHVME